MLIDRPAISNGVYCVFDAASKTDKLLSAHGASGTPVMRKNATLREIAGRSFSNTTRVALFPYGAEPTSKDRAAAKADLIKLLAKERPGATLVFPTPGKAMLGKDEKAVTKGTVSWEALHAPDSMDSMRGTFWHAHATNIVAMFPCQPIIDERSKVVNRRWYQYAEATARLAQAAVHRGSSSRVVGLRQQILLHVEEPLLHALDAMTEATDVALDIETIDSQGIITALGLATGDYAVSIPWDRWQPSAPGLAIEPGLADYGPIGVAVQNRVRSLLANPRVGKVGHNFLYDISRLNARGYEIAGSVNDTLCAHAIVHPTLRHGLQKAVATELPCAPWKSLFKVPGLSRSDERFWRYEPIALRQYNAEDAAYTWELWQRLSTQLI